MRRLAYAAPVLLLFVAAAATSGSGFHIIVNPANPLTSIDKTAAAKLFLKKSTRFPDGSSARAVDLPEGSHAREDFSRDVLGKTVSSVAAYWQQQIFAGRELPPVTKSSEAEVIEYVRTNPDAIGYVSAEAVTSDVKVLAIR